MKLIASTIYIRNLIADDIPEAIRIHKSSFPGYFLSFLGDDFLTLLHRNYIKGDTEIALGAFFSGKIVGTVIGTVSPQQFYRNLIKYNLFSFMFSCIFPLIKKPSIFIRLINALFYRGDAPPLSGKGGLLASICIDPEFQNKGIGKMLIEEFCLKMNKNEADFVYLTTDRDDNIAVRKFYETSGWLLESQYATRQGRNMCRYWKTLG